MAIPSFLPAYFPLRDTVGLSEPFHRRSGVFVHRHDIDGIHGSYPADQSPPRLLASFEDAPRVRVMPDIWEDSQSHADPAGEGGKESSQSAERLAGCDASI